MKLEHQFSISDIKDEFRVWTQLAKPELKASENVIDICYYGFTEILNNVTDHSEGDTLYIRGQQDEEFTEFEIEDNGVGIFSKLIAHFGFDNEIHALIELVKGKLTVAPEAHSGEGLFFSSKMFDKFTIESGSISVSFSDAECAVNTIPHRQGTLIKMKIANNSQTIPKEVFDKFCDSEKLFFYKTKFFISLSALEGGLISRSQAKRTTARLESFGEVELNFSGVTDIGQAFADELLRVWPLKHPETKLIVTNANDTVSKMIKHISGRSDLPQPETVSLDKKNPDFGGSTSDNNRKRPAV